MVGDRGGIDDEEGGEEEEGEKREHRHHDTDGRKRGEEGIERGLV